MKVTVDSTVKQTVFSYVFSRYYAISTINMIIVLILNSIV